MSEERLQILKMVQSGQITAEEGARLLEALGGSSASGDEICPPVGCKGPTLLRVRITDTRTGRRKVEFQLPWNLVSVGLDMGARFSRKEIKAEDLVRSVEAGVTGKVMDILDEQSGEQVEIFVE